MYYFIPINIVGVIWFWWTLIFPVLSNKGKRTIYDAGLFGLLGDDDDEVSFFFSIDIHIHIHKVFIWLIFFLPYNFYSLSFWMLNYGFLATGICWFHARNGVDDAKCEATATGTSFGDWLVFIFEGSYELVTCNKYHWLKKNALFRGKLILYLVVYFYRKRTAWRSFRDC